MNQYETSVTDKVRPRYGGMKRYRVTLIGATDVRKTDELVTQEIPVLARSQQSVQIDEPAFFIPPRLSLPFLDSLSRADQPTLLRPALPMLAVDSNQVPIPAKPLVGGESYLTLAFGMVKSSGIYAIGAMASPLISLILTPFLTHHLTSINYGGLAILYVVIDLVTTITQLGLSPAFFRAYNGDYESQRDRSGVLSSSIILMSFVSLPIVIVMLVTAPWLSVFLFNSVSYSGSVRLTALVIILENLTVPGISWLRAEKRALYYSVLSIANMLLVLGTNLVLVGVLHVGVNGALLAKGVGYSIIVICTLPPMLLLLGRRKSLRIRFDIMRSMLLFGVPTIFGSMAAWVLQLSDRYLLGHFVSLAQAASYTVAYTLGAVLSPVILAPFGLAWTPVMYSIAKREDADRVFQLVFHWFNTILLFAAFVLSLLSTFILEALFPPAYHAAEAIIPIIALSTALIGVWYVFMTGVYLRRKTILEFLFMLAAASMNVLLNIFFIPHFEAMGAALSTLLAYILLVTVSYIVNQKIYPISFEIGSFLVKAFVGIALYVSCNIVIHPHIPALRWSISIGSILLYGLILALIEGLSIKKLKKVLWYVRKALSKEQEKAYA